MSARLDPFVALFNQIPKRGFSICHFKRKGDPKPHFWVGVPVGRETVILVCIITSQLHSRIEHYERTGDNAAMNSLIPILPGTFSFLTNPETVVECNLAMSFDLETFRYLVVRETFSVERRDADIPQELKDKIVQAIKESPVVKKIDKDLLG